MKEDIVHLAREAPLRAVPVVLDGIVRAPVEQLGNFCPTVAHLLVGDDEDRFFLAGPGILADAGVQLVVPPVVGGRARGRERAKRASSAKAGG